MLSIKVDIFLYPYFMDWILCFYKYGNLFLNSSNIFLVRYVPFIEFIQFKLKVYSNINSLGTNKLNKMGCVHAT